MSIIPISNEKKRLLNWGVIGKFNKEGKTWKSKVPKPFPTSTNITEGIAFTFSHSKNGNIVSGGGIKVLNSSRMLLTISTVRFI